MEQQMPMGIQLVIQRINKSLQEKSKTVEQQIQPNQKHQHSYDCKSCKNTGWIQQENGKYKPCRCATKKGNILAIKKAGLSEDALDKTFKNYITWNEKIKDMKNIATNYFISFEKVKSTKSNSLGLFGESGAGKTHLLIALINNFIKKNDLKIVYMSYIDSINYLKQNINSNEIYQKEIERYKKTELLVIDDLFKSSYTNSDIKIIMEIINYRYINKLPVMFSSELNINDLINVDKALGGRIKEMTENYLYQISGIENNYRLKN